MSTPRPRPLAADAPRWPALIPPVLIAIPVGAEARRRGDRERVDHLRAAVRPDADRDADLDLARPHRAHVPVHDDDGADRVGRAQALHRHREVRDHGDPVLHPRRQLPHARRRRAADDQFRVVDGRPLGRRPRPRRRDGLRAVRRGVGQLAGHGRRHRLDHPAGDGQAGLPAALRRRRHHDLRRARHPDSAVDRDGDVRGRDQHVGRRAVHRRHRPGARARHDARPDHVVARAQEQLSRGSRRRRGGSAGARSARASGACCSSSSSSAASTPASSRRPRPPR